jgi:hypothetical protein
MLRSRFRPSSTWGLPRPRRAFAGAVAALALALVGAPSALAASLNGNKAFGELASPSVQTPSTTATTRGNTGTTSESSNSQTLILVAGSAAVVLLCGIGYVIVRDARRVAPASDGDVIEARGGRDNAARHARRRAKAKAARQQRKRNR